MNDEQPINPYATPLKPIEPPKMINPPPPAKDLEVLTKAVQEVKTNLDYLVAAYGRNDEKRIFYWVGLISRQLTDVGRKMMGLAPLNQEGRAIKLPAEKIIV